MSEKTPESIRRIVAARALLPNILEKSNAKTTKPFAFDNYIILLLSHLLLIREKCKGYYHNAFLKVQNRCELNGEREFPPAFLRRCLRLTMENPDEAALKKIIQAHLGDGVMSEAEALIAKFIQLRDKPDAGDLATDQLLNAIYLVTRERSPVGNDKERLLKALMEYLTTT